jgi:plasmid stability protein
MAGLTVRNLGADTLEWLRDRAAEHRRSVNAELLEILSVARGDEIAAAMSGPAAATARKARVMGVRTRRSAELLRRDRERHGR